MNANIDKVNMSLDEIIKLEKKEKRFQQQNKNRPNLPKPAGANSPNKGAGRGRPPKQQQQQQKKPFGLLNKSKAIGKKTNNASRARGPGPAKAAALKSRLSGPGIGPKQQQQLGKMQNLARIRRRRGNNAAAAAVNPPANKVFNRYGGPNGRPANQQQAKFQNQQQQQAPRPANKLAGRKPIVAPKQAAAKRQPGQAVLTKAQSDLVKAKVAMQAARKNVQKAKRLLAARKGPIQQMAAAKNRGKNLVVKKRVAVAKKAKLIANNGQPRNAGLIKVSVPNNRKATQPQSTKPIIKRNRSAPKPAATAKGNGNRMVFY